MQINLPPVPQNKIHDPTDMRRAACELTNRIKGFEAWLCRHSGFKVRAAVTSLDPNVSPMRLLFDKWSNGEWSIIVSATSPDDAFAADGCLLRDASSMVKAQAVALFPGLIQALQKASAHQLTQTQKAIESFDVFARAYGVVMPSDSTATVGIDMSPKPEDGPAMRAIKEAFSKRPTPPTGGA